jgi:hypothetical protein
MLLSMDRYIMDVSMVLIHINLDPTTRHSKDGGKVRTDFVIVDITIAAEGRIELLLSYHERILVPVDRIPIAGSSGWNRTVTSRASHAGLRPTKTIDHADRVLHNNTCVMGRKYLLE